MKTTETTRIDTLQIEEWERELLEETLGKPAPPGFRTVPAWAKIWGITRYTVGRKIQKLVDAGVLEEGKFWDKKTGFLLFHYRAIPPKERKGVSKPTKRPIPERCAVQKPS